MGCGAHRSQRAAQPYQWTACNRRASPLLHSALIWQVDLSDDYFLDDALPMFSGPGQLTLKLGGLLSSLVIPAAWIALLAGWFVMRQVAIRKKVCRPRHRRTYPCFAATPQLPDRRILCFLVRCWTWRG